jgi:hypothetical protein
MNAQIQASADTLERALNETSHEILGQRQKHKQPHWITLTALAFIEAKTQLQPARNYGKFVEAIRALYDYSASRVYVDGQYSQPFDITTGVLLGLFAIHRLCYQTISK